VKYYTIIDIDAEDCHSAPHAPHPFLTYVLFSLISSLSALSWYTTLCSSLSELSGVLYRLIGEASEGAEREDHLKKAAEALQDALELRVEMTGVIST
jgi:hypothetical protein